MLVCFTAVAGFAQHDLSLFRVTNDVYVTQDQVISVTYVVTNDLGSDVDGVTVQIDLPAGLEYIQHSLSQTFDAATGIWNLGSIAYFQPQRVITLDLRVVGEGVLNINAEIASMQGTDIDSTPSGGDIDEDDTVSACVSVPIRAECGQSVRLAAPAGRTRYQWYKDGLEISGATAAVLNVGESGQYSFRLDDLTSTCPLGSCCPAVVSFDSISVTLSQPVVCTGGFDTVRVDMPDVDDVNFVQTYTWASIDDPMLNFLSCTTCAEPDIVVNSSYLNDSLRYVVSVVTNDRVSGAQVCAATATISIEVLQAPIITFDTPVYACADACVTLGFTTDLPIASVEWDGPNLRTADDVEMTYCPRPVDAYTSETFVVAVYGLDGCKRVDSVEVITIPALELQVAAASTVCQSTPGELVAIVSPSINPDSLLVLWTEAPANPNSGANLPTANSLAVSTADLEPGSYSFSVSVTRIAPDGSLTCTLEATQTLTVSPDCEQPRIGGFAWKDANADGIRQDFEAPLENVTAELFTGAGAATGLTTTTDIAGFYEFTELAVGDYYVEFNPVAGFVFAPQNQGADEFLDSDVDMTGRSDVFAATYDQTLHIVSAGYSSDCQVAFTNVQSSPADCGLATGTLSFEVFGLSGPQLTYAWAPAVSDTTSASGLTPGDYEVTVFDPFTECSYTETFTVGGSRNFLLTASSSPAACPMGAGGSITLFTDGGTPPFAVTYDGVLSGTATASMMPYTIQDLRGGQYTLSVTDADGCQQLTAIEVGENELLLALEVVDFTQAGCNGARDGSFEVEVTGFELGYTLKVDGFTVVANTSQPSVQVTGQAGGSHEITATDVNGCTQVLGYYLDDAGSPIDTNKLTITLVDCFGSATGAIASTTGETYEIRNSRGRLLGALPQNRLTAGVYTLVDRSVPGCTSTAAVTITQPDAVGAVADINGQDCGVQNGSISLSVTGGTGDYNYTWSNGLPANAAQSNLSAGTYNVTIRDDANCVLDTSFVVPNRCEPLVCEPYFTADTLLITSANATYDWCFANFDLPTGRTFEQDGTVINPELCSRNGLVYFNLESLPGDGADGPYIIEFWYGGDELVLAEVVDDAAGFAAALDRADSWGRWRYDATENNVRGGQPGRAYGEVEVTHLASGRTVYLTPRTLPNQQSTTVSLAVPGSYKMATTDPVTGCRDSVQVMLALPDPCVDVFEPQNIVAATPYCDDAASVCLDIPFTLYDSYTLAVDGQLYSDLAEPCGLDEVVYYSVDGVDFEGETLLERWTVEGRVESARVASADELAARMQAFDGEAWRYDAALNAIRGGDPDRDYRDLRLLDAAGARSTLAPRTDIYDGTRVFLVPGTHSASLDAANGCSSPFSITLTCSAQTPPVTDTVRWTLGVGYTDTLCINLDELPGAPVRVENLCAEASGEYALITIDGEACLAGLGVEVGNEQVCVLACDADGVCDTTIVLVEVLSPEDYIFPEANPDRDSLAMNGSILVDVLGNDRVRGTFVSLEVVEYPDYGQAFVEDGQVRYTADPQFCGIDEFVYELCNTRGCDTAIVSMRIECDDLIIFSGFSPNFDDVNETFTVLGVEQYPGNLMEVFNRQGHMIFSMPDYDNSWRGTDPDGDDLSEGTYFYRFEDGRGRVATGYVYINR